MLSNLAQGGYLPKGTKSSPDLKERKNFFIFSTTLTGQVLSNEVLAHYRCQYRNYRDTTETMYTSLDALATCNHPEKY